MSNVKQLSIAAYSYAYAAERNAVFPAADTWPRDLAPYLGDDDELLRSPHNPDAGRAYAMNAQLDGRSQDDGRHYSRTVLFFEAEFGSPPAGGPELLPAEPRGPGGYVIGFADGAVMLVPKHEVRDLIWNLDDQ